MQYSTTSHGPADARQVWLDGAKASGGQLPFEQYSATSHGPVADLQRVCTVTAEWTQLVPFHQSVVQTLLSSHETPWTHSQGPQYPPSHVFSALVQPGGSGVQLAVAPSRQRPSVSWRIWIAIGSEIMGDHPFQLRLDFGAKAERSGLRRHGAPLTLSVTTDSECGLTKSMERRRLGV